MEGVLLNSANYVPLSPISFLERAAFVYGDGISIMYGATTFTWRETRTRCVKLASALKSLGISSGDVVAVVAPNVPALYELHFGVPMVGAVLSTLNTKLDELKLASTFEQIEARIVFVDYQYVESTLKALTLIKVKLPILVVIPEHDQCSETPQFYEEFPIGTLDYDQLLSMGDTDFEVTGPSDENCPISINFTSGSTGKPKGVVYSHRAAYLASLGQIFRTGLRPGSTFLWTVDMFRCNGWCFTWSMAALGGTNICIRSVTTKAMHEAISLHNITTICGPPSILKTIANCPFEQLATRVDVFVAGSLPPTHVVEKVKNMGFNLCLAYGMSEALGPVTADNPLINGPHSVTLEGIHNLMMEGVDVKDSKTMVSVPRDGKTIGEVMFKGNIMMLGYLKNHDLTKKAFQDGWYHTGDLGIRKLDGSIEMKDRALDIINTEEGTVVSLEVEAVLANHPRIDSVAVIGRPTEVGGQRPCAFVKLKEGWELSEDEIISFCKKVLPDFKVPTTIVFGDLPMINGAKVQKFILRDRDRKDVLFSS
ncbi:butanoate--CoA ligase AAE1-like [Impatiens glandulifera]|uniref:butanoate--CoA ligase AAE1-like n=1 Tax=Impatiens glandulifera TaxID=253017 RepID=UPI001FB14011|nr:butanoate--CoA ligase AAE1-like [Impatiens glandulifera]